MKKVFLQLDEYRPVNHKNDILYRCPLCGKPELYWNIMSHLGGCWGCPHKPGYNLHTIKKICKINTMSVGRSALQKPEIIKPEPVALHPLPIEAQAFLCGDKHIPEQYLSLFGWDPAKRQVSVPLYHCTKGTDGTRISRSVDHKGWYIDANTAKDQYLFPMLAGHRSSQALFLVEGVFDALSIAPYAPVVALLGAKLYNDQAKWIKDRCAWPTQRSVVIWLDPPPDKAGMKGTLEAYIKLHQGYGVSAIRMQDASEEPNDTPPESIQRLVDHYENLARR